MSVPLLTDNAIGKYLKIVSKGAVYNNFSEDSEVWSMVKQMKAGPAQGRELRYNLRSALGAAAAGFVPLNGGAYPSGQKSTLNEGTMVYKDFAVSIEVERTLIEKAIKDFDNYGKPLAEELRSKTIALSRQLSMSLYKDGTGVIGQITSAAASSNDVVWTLSSADTARGFIGWFEEGDRLVTYTEAAGVVLPDSSASYSYAEVVSKDRQANTVTVRIFDTNGSQINQATAANYVSGTIVYRKLQETNSGISNLSTVGTTTDYNSLSFGFTGLESLTQNDNRLVNGINQTGNLSSVRRDLSGGAIDSQDFQQAMSQTMIRVGQGRYKYEKSLLAWETLDALVESREVDRRFQSIKDDKRGVDQLGYVHGKNTLIFTPDEFCPKNRVYTCPTADVLQFHGADFEFVNPNGTGQNFQLRPNANGYDRTVMSFMEGSGALSCVHMGAINVIHNFTV